jgi:hypothetical protein
MPNYQDGKIYKIYNDDNDLVYYGSSCQPLYKRLFQHKQDAKQKKKYQSSIHNLDVDIEKCKIVLVENYSCNSKEELHARERFYIENNICINKNIPLRTYKEYCEAHKEEIAKKNKQWREDNKEELAKKRKQYNENHKEEIAKKSKKWREDNKEKIAKQVKQYSENHKEELAKYHKQYREDNKEKIAKQVKQYSENHKEELKQYSKKRYEDNKEKIAKKYEDNKEAISNKNKEKITCECGTMIRKTDLPRHKKTIKHKNYLSSLESSSDSS